MDPQVKEVSFFFFFFVMYCRQRIEQEKRSKVGSRLGKKKHSRQVPEGHFSGLSRNIYPH